MWWYIKAGPKWDWRSKKPGESIRFSADTKKGQYWREAAKDDIVVCHSTQKLRKKHSYFPQITAIGVISLPYRWEYAKDLLSESGDTLHDGYYVKITKKIDVRSPLQIGELTENKLLEEAEPFKPGTNRFTITKLEKYQYLEIKRLILEKNPDLGKKFANLKDEGGNH